MNSRLDRPSSCHMEETKEQVASEGVTVTFPVASASVASAADVSDCTDPADEEQSSENNIHSSKKMKHAESTDSTSSISSADPSTTSIATAISHSNPASGSSGLNKHGSDVEMKEDQMNVSDACAISSSSIVKAASISSSDCSQSMQQAVSSSSATISIVDQTFEFIAALSYRTFVHISLLFAPLSAYRAESIESFEDDQSTMRADLIHMRSQLHELKQQEPIQVNQQHQALANEIAVGEEVLNREARLWEQAQAKQQEEQKRLNRFNEQSTLDCADNLWKPLWQLFSQMHAVKVAFISECDDQSVQWARSWTLEACELLEELTTSEKLLSTPTEERVDAVLLISWCARLSAFHLIPSLLQRFNLMLADVSHFQSLLIDLVLYPLNHCVDHTPSLQFINSHGLEGVSVRAEGMLLFPPAVEMARQFVGENSPPSVAVSTVESANSLNILRTTVMQQTEDDIVIERNRRNVLHARFMFQLAAVWHSHSQSVRSLLMQADPTTLISDLVNICADYLDLDPADASKCDGCSITRTCISSPSSLVLSARHATAHN